MDFTIFLSVYAAILGVIFIYESKKAIAEPDETFDKTHGLYRLN